MADRVPPPPFTLKEQLFIEYYTGNMRETIDLMRGDGHRISDTAAYRWGRRQDIIDAIKAKYGATAIEDANILQKVELQEFWTEVIRDKDIDMTHRLNASEKLGKSMAAFVDRSVNHNVEENSLADILEDVEELEKEEEEVRKLLA